MFGRLLLLFILVPIIELSLFMLLGKHLGLGTTLFIIVVTAFIGAALTKSQGGKALANFQNALAMGKMPHKEMVDGLLILIAGAVLLTPGFLTDTVGFLLLLPPVRAVIRQVLTDKLAKKIHVSVGGNPLDPDFDPLPEQEGESAKSVSGKVIDI
ncbi:FxsA family protein [Roseibacillus persicicus]|uniref:FxsA family protein n=1 Tax=Roseibacillus persicicus TaxID=454148 RepID=UPI00280D1BAD|nr:FxsA family protein [Roseibacillus persicicus]MDQ8189136.1 FxsA family protein [Roseibacillus persicicus]